MVKLRWLAGMAMVALALGACGGGGGQTNNADGLKAAVKSSAEAYYRGDAKEAYRSFSKECQGKVPYSQYAATVKVASAMFEGFFDMKLSDLKVKTVVVKDVADGKGQASATLEAKGDEDLNMGADEFHPWTYEGGAWKQTDCTQMTMDD
jgi:hypothetical protein